MGYQIAVTPLQVAAAFSSVANGGEYIEPRVLRAVYRDGRRYPITPKIVRRTISAETAATLTTIMEAVVTDGTAKLAQIGGFTIAGKTGTASKLIDGRYSASENNVSFAGFLPPGIRPSRSSSSSTRRMRRQHGRRRRGADLQAHRRVDAALSRHRSDDQPGAAGAR